MLEVFRDADHILHAGDVGSIDILAELEAIAPVTAVWGNTDEWNLRSGLPEVGRVRLESVDVVIVHGQQFGSPSPRIVADAYSSAGLVVFGHSHEPVIELVGETLAVNPGSAGPRRFKQPTTVALASIEGDAIDARLVHLSV